MSEFATGHKPEHVVTTAIEEPALKHLSPSDEAACRSLSMSMSAVCGKPGAASAVTSVVPLGSETSNTRARRPTDQRVQPPPSEWTPENKRVVVRNLNVARLSKFGVNKANKEKERALAELAASKLSTEITSPSRRLECAFSTCQRATAFAREFGTSRCHARNIVEPNALCIQMAYGMVPHSAARCPSHGSPPPTHGEAVP